MTKTANSFFFKKLIHNDCHLFGMGIDLQEVRTLCNTIWSTREKKNSKAKVLNKNDHRSTRTWPYMSAYCLAMLINQRQIDFPFVRCMRVLLDTLNLSDWKGYGYMYIKWVNVTVLISAHFLVSTEGSMSNNGVEGYDVHQTV